MAEGEGGLPPNLDEEEGGKRRGKEKELVQLQVRKTSNNSI